MSRHGRSPDASQDARSQSDTSPDATSQDATSQDATSTAATSQDAGAPGSEQTAAAKSDAPHPDDARKPDSPDDLTKQSWKYVLKKTVREFNRDQATDLAAALTYWAVLAVAPAVLALVSLLGVFGDADVIVNRVMNAARGLAPEQALATIEDLVSDLTGQQGAGIGLIIGLLIALWSASGYVNAFSRAMNRMYELDEGRPFWKLRPIMLLVTLVVLVLVALICVALVLSGGVAEAVGAAIGLSDFSVTVWNIAKWPVVVGLVVVIIAVLYYATPNVRQPKMKWISVGSVVAIVVWAIATAGFALYVAKAGNYEATYGALAGVIVFLLWLWITNNALLFGAELDAELERARELQAGIAAEETVQLPPRDTKASDKKAKKREKEIAEAKALRQSRGRTLDAEERWRKRSEALDAHSSARTSDTRRARHGATSPDR